MSSNLLFWLETGYWAGVALIVLGVGLEGAEILHRRRWWRIFKRHAVVEPWNAETPEHKPKAWINACGDFGWLILVVGLILELVCGLKIDVMKTSELIRVATELKDTQRDASKANVLAGEAHLRAALTESNNLILRSNIVVLENKLRPRIITSTQVTNFIFLTEKIPKIPITIRAGVNSDMSYAVHLRGMFTAAGFGIGPINTPEGVQVDLNRFAVRPPGESYEWPPLFIRVNDTNFTGLPWRTQYRYEVVNGRSRPVTVNTNDKAEILKDLMAAFRDNEIIFKPAQAQDIAPGEFEIEIPPK